MKIIKFIDGQNERFEIWLKKQDGKPCLVFEMMDSMEVILERDDLQQLVDVLINYLNEMDRV